MLERMGNRTFLIPEPENLNYWPKWLVHWSYERSFDVSFELRDHYEIPFALVAFYLFTIFTIRHFMQDRKPFELKVPLILWNGLLAFFSIVGFYHVCRDAITVIRLAGLKQDMCDADAERLNPYVYLFCLSKIPELFDTVFIVLRKRPLIVLHVYHHIITMLYCWDAVASQANCGGWFALVNLGVHSIMYTYYTLCSMGFRFPNPLRQAITSLQIVQMFGGLAVVFLSLAYCNLTERVRLNLYFALAMYFSFLILFVNFFIRTYIFPNKPTPHAGDKDKPKKEQ